MIASPRGYHCAQKGDDVALDASQMLGSPQLAGVKVNPRGMAKRVARNVSGGLPARLAYGTSSPVTSETPHFGRLAYLVVTESELALVTLKSGIARVFLNEVVQRVPRTAVHSAELGGGVAPPLTINFADGGSWQVEVPRPSKRYATTVVSLLNGS